MSLKHAILGFLSFKSLSGYDLKKAFDRSVQHFWPANQSQIYRELSSLHEEGLVEQEVIEREDRLNKKLYHITPGGREELHSWLSTPLPVRDTRDPFLIQLYFGGKLSDEEILNLLEHEAEQVQSRIDEYQDMYDEFAEAIAKQDDPRSYFLSVITLEFGLYGERFMLEWLKSVAERIRTKEYKLKNF
jgi:PadR family transcriptional regulator AphA